jgi:excisionase family DNA binding protein
MENLLNVNQVAFILKVHPLTVRRYIKENKLKAVKAGGAIRIKESEVTAFTQDFTPHTQAKPSDLSHIKIKAKEFGDDDPFLRLEGRGASVNLENRI